MKKRILAVVLAGLMLVGMTVPCLAGETGLKISTSPLLLKATFTHVPDTGAGQQIKVEQEFTEQHSTTKQFYYGLNANTMVGGASTVTAERNADIGYKYIHIGVTKGKVNGITYATIKEQDIW